MGHGAFVLEYASKIAAINPAAAGWAFDEMLGLTLRRVAEKLPNIFAAWNGNHFFPRFLATGRRRGLCGFSSSIASLVHMLASFRHVARSFGYLTSAAKPMHWKAFA
jgi:hypothetical protein